MQKIYIKIHLKGENFPLNPTIPYQTMKNGLIYHIMIHQPVPSKPHIKHPHLKILTHHYHPKHPKRHRNIPLKREK